LAQAGADVTFVARGAHLAAMQKNGLRVEGGRGDTLISPCQATDDPASIGPVDIVMFFVKLWDVESAGERIKPLIGPNTAVITFQNGIDAPERLVPILGAGAVMGGVAQISATIAEPGVIRQTGTFMRLVFGELGGGKSARGEAFLALCKAAGFDAMHSAAIMTDIWMKFIILATNSAFTAATRTPIGKLGGGLSSLKATKLGAVAIEATLRAADLAQHPRRGDLLRWGSPPVTYRVETARPDPLGLSWTLGLVRTS
jgi:2-dehydropantoate 2-reductase